MYKMTSQKAKEYVYILCKCGALNKIRRPKCGYLQYEILDKCRNCNGKNTSRNIKTKSVG